MARHAMGTADCGWRQAEEAVIRSRARCRNASVTCGDELAGGFWFECTLDWSLADPPKIPSICCSIGVSIHIISADVSQYRKDQ